MLSCLQTSNSMPPVSSVSFKVTRVLPKDRLLTPSILVFSMTKSSPQRQLEWLQDNKR